MRTRTLLLACAAAMSIGAGAAFAEPGDGPPDPDGYYSRTDHDGYYDRQGHYRHFDRDDRYQGDDNGPPPPPPPPDADRDGPPPPDYYREGAYERQCHSGTAAGTVFGAAGGGLIAGAASHGNPAAIVGGVLLGGLFGHAISHDIDCEDQRYAFDTYATGLNGEIGHRYEWAHGDAHGYFVPTREYTDDGLRCREFTSVTYKHGQEYHHDGSACYQRDGNWHFNDE